MTWVRLDDTWCDSEPVVQVGPLAAWLHVCALSWSNRSLTDGRLPARVIKRLADLPDPLAEAAQLVTAGLWEETLDGYLIVGYAEWQPTAEKVHYERAAKRERQERWLAKKKVPDASGATPRDVSRDASQVRTRDVAPPRPAPKGSGSRALARRGLVCPHGLRRILATDGGSSCSDCDAAEPAAS